jgi:hypothetical protein
MFQTVLDCGLFHIFNAEEKPGYVTSLAPVTPARWNPVLCFSDDGPDIGPHPVRQEELRAAFDSKSVDGTSPPSNRTGFRRDITTPASGLVRDKQTDLACGIPRAREFAD